MNRNNEPDPRVHWINLVSVKPPYLDPRVIICLSCHGVDCEACEECQGEGKIRVPTRAENESRKNLYTLARQEIVELRRIGVEAKVLDIILYPCQVCGKLWEHHPSIGFGLRLCPMTDPEGVQVGG